MKRIASANGAMIFVPNTASSPSCASFSRRALMALTATATERVRDDIVKQLSLRDPSVLRREFQSAESHLSRPGQEQALTSKLLDFMRARREKAESFIARAAKPPKASPNV